MTDVFPSPLHLVQYHSRIAFAFFSVMLMQWPWNHSLQLSQPLSGRRKTKELIIVASIPSDVIATAAANLHHETVDVWFPADAVQGCVLTLHTAGLRPRCMVNVRQLAVLRIKNIYKIKNKHITNGRITSPITGCWFAGHFCQGKQKALSCIFIHKTSRRVAFHSRVALLLLKHRLAAQSHGMVLTPDLSQSYILNCKI